MTNNIEIDRNRVQKVVRVAVEATAREVKHLHPVEAVIGFAEVLGRAIAAQDVSPIAHKEMIKVAFDHVANTITAAYLASGKNPNSIR